jgi:hypothetical protein
MLQTKSVTPQLLELLRFMMGNPVFSPYNLVGGTALALQIGHRISVDLDMFGDTMPEVELLTECLLEIGSVHILQHTPNILICSVNGIKVDFVYYKYSLLRPCNVIENVRLVSTADIAAMKLNVIVGCGSKKDFIDLYYLLKEYTIEQMLHFYTQKYPQGSEFLAMKCLTYFDDADKESTPILLDDISWPEIKSELQNVI